MARSERDGAGPRRKIQAAPAFALALGTGRTPDNRAGPRVVRAGSHLQAGGVREPGAGAGAGAGPAGRAGPSREAGRCVSLTRREGTGPRPRAAGAGAAARPQAGSLGGNR